jgi:hypothetical protein
MTRVCFATFVQGNQSFTAEWLWGSLRVRWPAVYPPRRALGGVQLPATAAEAVEAVA